MDDELKRRMADLSARCKKSYDIVAGNFLSPAEIASLAGFCPDSSCELTFFGGDDFCERRVPFFYPDYLEPDSEALASMLQAVHLTVKGGELSHRDVLGSVLGLGIRREGIGDIRVLGDQAYLFALPSAAKTITCMLEKVSRYHVETELISCTSVPAPVIQTKAITFTVQSIRFDAVLAGLFSISRTDAAEQIRAGNACLNYLVCEKTDAKVEEGAILSLRGYGKGTLKEIQGTSRKGRIFIRTERYL